jgi:hypothetical protein
MLHRLFQNAQIPFGFLVVGLDRQCLVEAFFGFVETMLIAQEGAQ